MVYLSKYKDSFKSVIIEDTNKDNASIFPSFYAQNWMISYGICKPKNNKPMKADSVRAVGLYRKEIYSLNFFDKSNKSDLPGFVLFVEDENLTQRVANIKAYFPEFEYKITIEPSNLDKFMHTINPKNKNFNVHIYKTNAN
jgi:hypothetical protein